MSQKEKTVASLIALHTKKYRDRYKAKIQKRRRFDSTVLWGLKSEPVTKLSQETEIIIFFTKDNSCHYYNKFTEPQMTKVQTWLTIIPLKNEN